MTRASILIHNCFLLFLCDVPVQEFAAMDMSLDDIIASRGKGDWGKRKTSLKVSVGNGRKARLINPYNASEKVRPAASKATSQHNYEASLKMIFPNPYVSVLIGTGGENMRQLWTETGAQIHVSDASVHFPGTSDRVIYIAGTLKAVTYAQALLWELVGFCQSAEGDIKRPTWSAKNVAAGDSGHFDDVEVSGVLTVPSLMGGHIVGRRGAGLQHLSGESGAQLSIDDKDDPEVLHTQERVITLRGTAAACMKCTSLILELMSSVENGTSYKYKGTAYPLPSAADASTGERRGRKGDLDETFRGEKGRVVTRIGADNGGDVVASSGVIEVLSANTTIEIAVPDKDIGVLLGIGGAKLSEIQTLSGSKIFVSQRGEFVEGTRNRLVTIVGNPSNAQTAHTLILNTLKSHVNEK